MARNRERTVGLLWAVVAGGVGPMLGCLAGDVVCFEAESAVSITAPAEVADVSAPSTQSVTKAVGGASGERYVDIAQGKGNPPEVAGGEMKYAFDVTDEGVYWLWCRVWWLDECGNSFTMSMDGQPGFTFGQDATYKVWHWVKAPSGLTQLKLGKGRHTLTVKNREDGVKLDQILFTRDRRYVPVDIEEVTAPAGESRKAK